MNAPEQEDRWFEDWFDSPYYHLLYRKRNEEEASAFVKRLYTQLAPPPNSRALDLACGKGRYAIELNKLGMQVTGIDLSQNSISIAEKFIKEGLEFYVHDMRRPFRIRYFDYVFNLFTSFGYFSHESDNRAVIQSVHKGLKPDGKLIIDFMNSKCVAGIIGKESNYEENVDSILFHIHKRVENGQIHKQIQFNDKGRNYSYTERVQLFQLSDFERLLTGLFHIEKLFGGYDLSPFNENASQRLILVAQKK